MDKLTRCFFFCLGLVLVSFANLSYTCQEEISHTGSIFITSGQTAKFNCPIKSTVLSFKYEDGKKSEAGLINTADSSFECSTQYSDGALGAEAENIMQSEGKFFVMVTVPFPCENTDNLTQVFCEFHPHSSDEDDNIYQDVLTKPSAQVEIVDDEILESTDSQDDISSEDGKQAVSLLNSEETEEVEEGNIIEVPDANPHKVSNLKDIDEE